MFSWQRLLFLLSLALVEATVPSLLLTLAGGAVWGSLVVAVLVGALTVWLADRWAPEEWMRPALAIGALASGLWVVKAQLGGGVSLLAGWGQLGSLTGALPGFGLAYLTLLGALYAFWRGISLSSHDSGSLGVLFGRVAFALVIIITLGVLAGGGRGASGTLATLEVISFFIAGLLGIALSSTLNAKVASRRLDVRGALTVVGAVGLVVVLGLAVAALFGAGAAQVFSIIWRGVASLLLLLALPLLLLVGSLLTWLLGRLGPLPIPPLMPVLADPLTRAGDDLSQSLLRWVPPWLFPLVWGILILLPILGMVALVVLLRRRRSPDKRDEERESLLSWGTLAGDLRDLFGALRRARPTGGLRAALARLRGADPASRIRRSYIRLLLRGERRQQPRAPAQTPQEYRAATGAGGPALGAALAALTNSYDQARYHPDSVDADAADAAERAWRAIDQAEG